MSGKHGYNRQPQGQRGCQRDLAEEKTHFFVTNALIAKFPAEWLACRMTFGTEFSCNAPDAERHVTANSAHAPKS